VAASSPRPTTALTRGLRGRAREEGASSVCPHSAADRALTHARDPRAGYVISAAGTRPRAHFATIHLADRNFESGCNISLPRFAPRHTGAARRRWDMEIAAFVMCAAVLMGFLQQFDRDSR